MEALRAEETSLDKYLHLRGLRKNREDAFYRLLIDNFDEVAPYTYTPAVAEAVEGCSQMKLTDGGLILSASDEGGEVAQKIKEWPNQDFRIVIVTDGEAILSLGDRGANGLPVVEGKANLLTALGGIKPSDILPVLVDVGTNNQKLLLESPEYIGNRYPRVEPKIYDKVFEELVSALESHCKSLPQSPAPIIHFEDMGTANALRQLEKFSTKVACFNSDLQAAAAVVLAAIQSALRVTKGGIGEQRFLIYGTSNAAVGSAKLITEALVKEAGLSEEAARKLIHFFDEDGLLVKLRPDCEHTVPEYLLPFAHEEAPILDLTAAISATKPTVIIGASGRQGAFTEDVVSTLLGCTERPVVLILSTPNSREELTFADAVKWGGGKIIYAAACPQEPQRTADGKVLLSSQINDFFAYPFITAAAALVNAKEIPEEIFYLTAKTLASLVSVSDLEQGLLLPSLHEGISKTAVPLITAIAGSLVTSGKGKAPGSMPGIGVPMWIREHMYNPPTPTPSFGRSVSLLKGAPPEAAAYRELMHFRATTSPIQKYLFLRKLQETDEQLFVKVLMENAQEMLPYVYTPTVGEACQKYFDLGIKTHGLFLRYGEDSGKILERLKAWPRQDIAVIVVTDGERILGLGDLGAGGMGISEGKILLYSVLAGVPSEACLPVCLDVGTNTKSIIDNPNYGGLKSPRPRGEPYRAFVDEFIQALKTWRPHVLLQFEDFGNLNAFHLLEDNREKICCFNDDIQGTACIVTSGIFSALRVTGNSLADQRLLFLGAGEAGTGIGQLIAMAMVHRASLTEEEALGRCFFMDSKGLVCKERKDPLADHKLPFAHDVPFVATLLEAVKTLRPTVLIGVSAIPHSFSQEVVEAMAEINERPIIMPLSNPTSKAECTFLEAYHWTAGKVVFASGSPFEPIVGKDGKTIYPAQANNAYIFPAVGHAAVFTQGKSISDQVFLEAADALAELSTESELHRGFLFPPFHDIHDVSVHVMARVSKFMVDASLGTVPGDFEGDPAIVDNWALYARSKMAMPDLSKPKQGCPIFPLPRASTPPPIAAAPASAPVAAAL